MNQYGACPFMQQPGSSLKGKVMTAQKFFTLKYHKKVRRDYQKLASHIGSYFIQLMAYAAKRSIEIKVCGRK